MARDTHAEQKEEITGRTKRREHTHTHTHTHRSRDSCGGADVMWTSGASGGASQQEEHKRSRGVMVSTRNDLQEGMLKEEIKRCLNMPE